MNTTYSLPLYQLSYRWLAFHCMHKYLLRLPSSVLIRVRTSSAGYYILTCFAGTNRGISSSGRALDLHSRGTGIDTRILHFSQCGRKHSCVDNMRGFPCFVPNMWFVCISYFNYFVKLPRPGIEPGTFRSSVWRSPNWAISAMQSELFVFAPWLRFIATSK